MSKYFQVKNNKLYETDDFLNLNFEEMGDSDLIALCLEKWGFIKTQQYLFHFGGIDTCALCQKYFWQEIGCKNCPIALKTKERFCRNTPNHSLERNDYSDNLERYYELIDEEIQFLKDL